MDGPRQSFVLETSERPVALVLDPELRLFRRVAPGEAPPILRRAMLDPATAVTILSAREAAQAARTLAARLLENGGKTEVAAFPLLSAMVDQDWQGVSVLYVCPLCALLNNLQPRLHDYAQ